MIVDSGQYYIYRHIRLDTNVPFYIGLGTKTSEETQKKYNGSQDKGIYHRAYTKQCRSNFWHNIINKTDYKVEIILETDNFDFMNEKEIELIKLYGRRDLKKGTLVNLSDGGESHKGYIATEEHRRNLGNANRGRKCSKEQIEKFKESRKGYRPSEETKKKMALAKIGKSQYHLRKPIIQMDFEENFIKEWNSASEILKVLNINSGNIATFCKGRNCRKQVGGFKWKYKDN